MRNLAVSIFGTVTATLLLLNILVYFQLPGMVFFPTREIVSTPDSYGLPYQEVYLASTGGHRIHGWYLPKAGAKQALLFFHGNGGNISHRGDSLKIFSQLGLNVLIVDYQGYGKSEGGPSESALYDDARAAFNYLQQTLGFKTKDVIVFGRSLGGAVAARLAAETQPGAIILESTFSSTTDVAASVYPVLSKFIYLRYRFNTASQVKKIQSPILVLHSRGDRTIPFVFGEKVYASANNPKMFVEMVGDHNNGFIESQPGYQQVLGKFLEITRN